MSITFSSSENNYWCFFFIIIATRRKRRTQRDSETRERNEEKRTFCDRKTDELRTHRRFYHPRPFRRRLRNDLRYLFHILLHHRSTSRSRRRTHSARARASSSFPLSFLLARFLRTKNKRRKKRQSALELRYTVFSSAIVRNDLRFLFQCFIIIARRLERRNRRRRKTESRRRRRRRRLLRKRAPSRFYICIWVLCISPKKARVFFTHDDFF